MSSALFSPCSSPQPAPLPLPSYTLPHCPELDLSVTLGPAHTAGEPHLLRECVQDKLRPRGQTDRRANRKVHFKEPVVAMEMTEPCVAHRQPIKSQRRRGQGRESQGQRQRAEPPAAAANEEPACLQEARLNTTLALKAELESLEGAEFNAQRAVEETLQKLARTKNLISSRASEGVNVSHSQLLFTSLVSVDVQKDQLIGHAPLPDRLLLAPPPCVSGHKSSDSPSLLPFLTSDLHRQKPLPPDDDDPIGSRPIVAPTPRPAFSTFDLYRRRIRWEVTD